MGVVSVSEIVGVVNMRKKGAVWSLKEGGPWQLQVLLSVRVSGGGFEIARRVLGTRDDISTRLAEEAQDRRRWERHGRSVVCV